MENLMNKAMIKLMVSVISLCGSIHAMSRLEKVMGHIAPTAQVQKSVNIQKISAQENIRLGSRPLAVQEAADKAFDYIKGLGSGWLYDGQWSDYGLLQINDGKLLKRL